MRVRLVPLPPGSSWRLGLAGLLAFAAILALTTDLFRSPHAVVREALASVLASSPQEIRLVIDVRAEPAPAGDQYHHLNFRAGPGLLVRPATARPALQFPFRLVLERPGVTMSFRGDAVLRDGAGFVRFTEMPSYGGLGRVLSGRWLQLGEPKRGSGGVFGDADRERLAATVAAPVMVAVQRGPAERIRGQRARRFELRPDDERLQALLRELPGQFESSLGIQAVARFLEQRLEAFRLDRVVLWVVPRSKDLVRFRAEFMAREEASEVRLLVLDATFTPAGEFGLPDIPSGAVRLRPETVEKILRGPG